MRKLLSGLLCVVLFLSFASVSLAEGTFRVGMECNYAPFNWTQVDETEDAIAIDAGGFAGGYDVEIAKSIALALDKELEIVKIEWDGLIPALNAGLIDAVIAGMSPTEERKITVDFSDPYYESDLVIVLRKGSAFESAVSLNDFAGAKITAQLNTFHYTVIDQLVGVAKQPAMESFPAMIVALSSGVIDGYISERPGAVSACASNSDLIFVAFEQGLGFVTSPEDTAIAVAVIKGNVELVDQINAILLGIDAETRQAIMDNAVLTQPVSE